ncbi:MAG TPA: NUDIX domain-containing protein [Actinoplanes sp.]|nr:NUDIX domain-containing protein [Actinoplanes sp.]
MDDIDKIAWIHLADGRVLSTRNKGKDVFYFPGGKREAGESDLDTLVREVREELDVTITPGTAELFGVFTAQAHGHAPGRQVRMTCYTAGYTGQLRASSEIEEIAWLTSADRHRVSAVDQLVFDRLW